MDKLGEANKGKSEEDKKKLADIKKTSRSYDDSNIAAKQAGPKRSESKATKSEDEMAGRHARGIQTKVARMILIIAPVWLAAACGTYAFVSLYADGNASWASYLMFSTGIVAMVVALATLSFSVRQKDLHQNMPPSDAKLMLNATDIANLIKAAKSE